MRRLFLWQSARTALTLGLLLLLLLLNSLAVQSGQTAAAASTQARPWMNRALSPDRRADLLLAQMTLDEKIAMLHGWSGGSYVGYIPANARLGIPALGLEDGPAGVADGMTGVTAFPAPEALAASWDPTLARLYGQALGSEEWGKGANVALAPTVNILRNPQWGRSFETLGEDPYLTGTLASADIQGIQSQHVIATVKHYAANNQEYHRTTVSANVDERTLHEIYLPAFEAAVRQGGVGAVMCSYNKVNSVYACENPYLLSTTLKGTFDFPGFVMSDWGATHSTVPAITAGLDMEMPDSTYFGSALKQAVLDGQVSMATIDEAVHRILRSMFAIGLFDYPTTGSPSATVTNAQHAQLARQAAEAGTVLLKNSGQLLPLDASKLHSIAVIGPDASVAPQATGGGSAHVIPPYVVTPLQGISERAGSGVTVRYAQGITTTGTLPPIEAQYLQPPSGDGQGLQGEYFSNMTLSGSPVLTRLDSQINFDWNGQSPGPGVPATQWSARWTGRLTPPVSGTYTFSLTSDDGSRLYLNNQLLIDNWRDQATTTETATVQLTAGQSYAIRVEYYQNGGASNLALGWSIPGQENALLNQAVELARSSDVAIVFVNDVESEGSDRSSLELPGAQDQLIAAVAQANPHTIVVLNTGGPVLMPWVDQVPALLEAWYPGQEDGNAIAAVLFGDVNPSGKLPMTFPRSASDLPASTPAQYPGLNDQADYSEGVFVGYRYYDARGITPLFPFGYGLSYTTFRYSHLRVSPTQADYRSRISVDLDVTNTGRRAGAEVVQLYLGIPSTNVAEPPRQLKGFQKVFLQPGQTRHVHFELAPRDLSYWDVQAHGWVVQDGRYSVQVGSSSRDIRLQASFTVRRTNGPRYVSLQGPSLLAAGASAPVTTRFTNGGDLPVSALRLRLQGPAGWQVQALSPTSFGRVAAGGTVETRWQVRAPAGASAGRYSLQASASFVSADGPETLHGSTSLTVPYSSLAAAYNNVGISDDSNPGAGNFDGGGYSYSAQALTAVGLTPGATVVHAGLTFTWPAVPPGQPDNVSAQGQALAVSAQGSRLAFLGAAAFGTQSGTLTIIYSDGTSQQATLTLADWYANQPAAGDELLATADHWNRPPGDTLGPHAVSVYYTQVPLQAGKQIAYLLLPTNGNLHLFALAAG
ncbi:glycoside hydrolase family 3 C-terminal domain-containing protein [Thermogemmatispora sp.]|uniref:glycoside hydrolase family 3 C-terminal domain-containing protein n=1 Tax=Thermogemmatispora sp. TaxID=1968838 RepID=UPI0035E42B4F